MTVWQATDQPWLDDQRPAPDVPRETSSTGAGLQLFANIALSLETLTRQVQRDQDRRDRLAQMVPGDVVLSVQGIVPASGALVMDLGSCPLGRVWQVRRITIGGTTATATPTGAAFLYRTGTPPGGGTGAASLPISGVVDSWPSFSNGAQGSTYGTHQLWLPDGHHLFVAVSGGSAGVQWVAETVIEDYDASAWSEMAFAE